MTSINLQQSLDNMRGGCAYNFDGSIRNSGDYTNVEQNIKHWYEKYNSNPPKDVIDYWNKN